MRARALRDWASRKNIPGGGHEVHIYQTLESTHGSYAFGVWLYNCIQRRLPLAHHLYFNFLEYASLHSSGSRILGGKAFIKQMAKLRPDVIVSTHAHLNHGFFDLARSLNPSAPPRCITYCGELSGGYGFSRHWVNPRADAFIAATELTRQAAVNLGIDAARAWVGGFLLRPQFHQPAPDPNLCRQWLFDNFKLDPDRFVLVLSTGANGANNHLAMLRALSHLKPDLRPQVIALCAKDERSLARISRWAGSHANWPIRAVGPVENMAMLLHSATAVVARPGTGTTSEAILCGCPVLFNAIGGIMPQERITLRYLEKQGVSPKIVRHAAGLPTLLQPLISDKTKLTSEIRRMKGLRPRQNPADILRILSGQALDDTNDREEQRDNNGPDNQRQTDNHDRLND